MGILKMNFYELHEPVFGVSGSFEKFLFFLQFYPLFYVHFASSGSFISLCEAVEAVLMVFDPYFMNYMKIDEEGSLKENFLISFFCCGFFMNMKKWLTSSMFINCIPAPFSRKG